MKTSDIQLWQPFFNTNGHPTLPYKITETRVYVVNHNGSFYNLALDKGSNVNFKEIPGYTADDFFRDFPLFRLVKETREKYAYVKELYALRNKLVSNKKLLLL